LSDGQKKKYIEMFGYFTEPFISDFKAEVLVRDKLIHYHRALCQIIYRYNKYRCFHTFL